MLAGEKLENVTAELKRANNDIFRTPTAKTEYGVLARFRRLLHHGSAVKDNVLESNGYLYGADHGDKAIPKEGKHAYDKYMDSIELSGYIDYTKRHLHP